jgi:hypothetical protein
MIFQFIGDDKEQNVKFRKMEDTLTAEMTGYSGKDD